MKVYFAVLSLDNFPFLWIKMYRTQNFVEFSFLMATPRDYIEAMTSWWQSYFLISFSSPEYHRTSAPIPVEYCSKEKHGGEGPSFALDVVVVVKFGAYFIWKYSQKSKWRFQTTLPIFIAHSLPPSMSGLPSNRLKALQNAFIYWASVL